METTSLLQAIIMVLIIFSVILLFRIKKLKNVILFLSSVSDNNKNIKSTRFLASLGIKTLNRFGHKLIPFFQETFMLSVIEHNPAMIDKISDYIQRLKRLKDSPAKNYLISTFRVALLSSGIEGIAFIIYQSIKIKYRDRSDHGQIVESFVLEDAEELRIHIRELDSIIYRINFYEKSEPVLNNETRSLIKKNLIEVINVLVTTNKKI